MRGLLPADVGEEEPDRGELGHGRAHRLEARVDVGGDLGDHAALLTAAIGCEGDNPTPHL